MRLGPPNKQIHNLGKQRLEQGPWGRGRGTWQIKMEDGVLVRGLWNLALCSTA